MDINMINIELWNALIAAGTSVFVVILSQILIRIIEKKRKADNDKDYLCKVYINPIRFMLAENYYRIYEILNDSEKRENLLVVDRPCEVMEKDIHWFAGDGCYLISSCYLTSCLFAHLENIRNGVPFLKTTNHNDTEIIEIINRLVIDYSKGLKVFYVMQKNIGMEFYKKEEERIITYREFCTLLRNEENFIWYESLINYYLGMGNGEYEQQQILLVHIGELAKLFDKMVSGGDSIKQKMEAEGKK